jgi:hypothetical protein
MWLGAGIPTLLIWLHAQAYGRWVVDDAGLTFAYARSLATGAGAVLQPGATPVEGYSSPAWLAILVLGRWLGLFDHGVLFGQSDLVMFPKLLALACCFAMFAAMFAVAAAVARHPVVVTVMAGSATAAVPSFAIWTTSGLENALLACAVVGVAAVLATTTVDDRLLETSTAIKLGLLSALAALTRPEGTIYLLAYPIAVALIAPRSRRAVAAVGISSLTFAVPVVAYLVWRIVTFSDYLPNTARAKEQSWPALTDLGRPAELITYAGWITAVVSISVVTVALTRRGDNQRALIAVLVPLGLAVVAFAFLESDWMAQYRFATPVWPLTALSVAVAVVGNDGVMRTAAPLRKGVLFAAAGLAAVHSLNQFAYYTEQFRKDPTVGVCNIALNTGYQINGYADILGVGANGSLAAADGGGTSLTSRLRFVDLAGLAEPQVARFWQDDDMAGLRDYLLDDVRPTFVKLFTGWDHRTRVALTDDPRFVRDYIPLMALGPGGGDWVRRDAVPDAVALQRARTWGADALATINALYDGVVPVRWNCGATLRPTPTGVGDPAPSPLAGG